MQPTSIPKAVYHNFLGSAPSWYKLLIIAFMFINPIVFTQNPYIAGWMLVIEFIFTLAMALKCYPLLPGGLLAIQAVAMGMTSPAQVTHEVQANLDVILLLVFMVAGIHFMKDLLLLVFTKLMLKFQSKVGISIAFCLMSAFLSAFLDALTVIAVVISVSMGFYAIYHKVSSGKHFHDSHDHSNDQHLPDLTRQDLETFRGFLRNILMHSGVGTALGGVCTMVGEPQNLIIANAMSWQFAEFALRVAPVSIPVLLAGVLTLVLVEKFKLCDFGYELPTAVREILVQYQEDQKQNSTAVLKAKYIVQAILAVLLILCLSLHVATVGLIGLMIIILSTSLTGVNDEHAIGHSFKEALPFTALLVVFFVIVGVIIDQNLFKPIIDWVLTFHGIEQLGVLFAANGLLSMVSDNVFVGTVYINEFKNAWIQGNVTRDQLEFLAIAINAGTNLPSVATPNGQAAFLFLLTSSIAPLVRLSYMRMVVMAFPYTLTLAGVGLFCTVELLPLATDWMLQAGWIVNHDPAIIAPTPGH